MNQATRPPANFLHLRDPGIDDLFRQQYWALEQANTSLSQLRERRRAQQDDELRLIEALLRRLEYARTAEYRLQTYCLGLSQDHLQRWGDVPEYRIAAEVAFALGERLLALLRRYGLYQQGRLVWRLVSYDGGNFIFVHEADHARLLRHERLIR